MTDLTTYKIVKPIAVIESFLGGGGGIEFNQISYNDKPPVWDLHLWHMSEDGNRYMGRGIFFTDKQLKRLKDALQDIEL